MGHVWFVPPTKGISKPDDVVLPDPSGSKQAHRGLVSSIVGGSSDIPAMEQPPDSPPLPGRDDRVEMV
jgi:hypothetical protein